jgi:hypothetical protein
MTIEPGRNREVQTLLEQFDFFEDEDGEVSVSYAENGHSGPGLYVHNLDYPDEGSCFLGTEPESDDPIINANLDCEDGKSAR